jgi:hypothetical protein
MSQPLPIARIRLVRLEFKGRPEVTVPASGPPFQCPEPARTAPLLRPAQGRSVAGG